MTFKRKTKYLPSRAHQVKLVAFLGKSRVLFGGSRGEDSLTGSSKQASKYNQDKQKVVPDQEPYLSPYFYLSQFSSSLLCCSSSPHVGLYPDNNSGSRKANSCRSNNRHCISDSILYGTKGPAGGESCGFKSGRRGPMIERNLTARRRANIMYARKGKQGVCIACGICKCCLGH